MSQENIELVLSAWAAYLQGDDGPLYALASPEIVVRQFPDQLDVRDFTGREGLRLMMDEWIGTWDDWTVEPVSSSAEDDLVFVTAMQRGRGKGSGAPMESEATFVFTLHDGSVTRWQMFHSEAEARTAIGR